MRFFLSNTFLAHVSQNALAAVGLAGWLYATLVVIAFGTMSSINVLIAHKHGERDNNGISFVFRDGLLLTFLDFDIHKSKQCFYRLFYKKHAPGSGCFSSI